MARGGFLISLWCGQGPEGTSGPGSSAYKHQRRLVVLYTTRGIIYYTWYIIPTTPPGWLRDHPWGLSDQPLVRAGTGGYQWARIKRLEAPAAPCSIIYYTWYYIPQKSLLYYISSYPLSRVCSVRGQSTRRAPQSQRSRQPQAARGLAARGRRPGPAQAVRQRRARRRQRLRAAEPLRSVWKRSRGAWRTAPPLSPTAPQPVSPLPRCST